MVCSVCRTSGLAEPGSGAASLWSADFRSMDSLALQPYITLKDVQFVEAWIDV